MKIFIGNLDYDTNDKDLKKSFEKFGEVDSVKVIIDKSTGKSKGFGFVEMLNDNDAIEAIKKLNNTKFNGREIYVEEAKQKESETKKKGKNTEEISVVSNALSIYVDKGTAKKEDIVNLLSKLNKLYRLHGGNEIIYSEKDVNIFELFNS